MGVFSHWPNRITALRFIGALFLFGILQAALDRDPAQIRGLLQIAFWLFVVTAATDFLDGYLARSGNLVSAFGRIADTFTDKVLILGALVFLAVMPWSAQYLPTWVVVVILARELLVSGIRSYVESTGDEFAADRFGKLKMVAQCVAVATLLWTQAYDWPENWLRYWTLLAQVLVWTTLALTVGSGLNYAIKTSQLMRKTDR